MAGIPFRAEHVGSLLRPQALREARRRFSQGQLDRNELRVVEDEEIRLAVATQENLGFHAVTDGEFRRTWWHLDFLEGLLGVEKYEMTGGMAFAGTQTRAEGVRVTGPIAFDGHPMVAHVEFLAGVTTRVAKQCIPAPSALFGRRGREAVSRDVYPSLDRFWSDLGDAYRKAVNAFVAAGCRYIQLDEVFLIMLCDERHRAGMAEQGLDADALARTYGDLINMALADLPPHVTSAIHLCRGNFKSAHLGSGAYDRIVSVLFERIRVNGYFMEYDTERAGGFEPLAHLPEGRRAVLGLISSKTGVLEDPAAIEQRIEQAMRFAPLDRLAISPQCGFASTEEGNLVSPEEQWAKLNLVVQLAKGMWQDAVPGKPYDG